MRGEGSLSLFFPAVSLIHSLPVDEAVGGKLGSPDGAQFCRFSVSGRKQRLCRPKLRVSRPVSLPGVQGRAGLGLYSSRRSNRGSWFRSGHHRNLFIVKGDSCPQGLHLIEQETIYRVINWIQWCSNVYDWGCSQQNLWSGDSCSIRRDSLRRILDQRSKWSFSLKTKPLAFIYPSHDICNFVVFSTL